MPTYNIETYGALHDGIFTTGQITINNGSPTLTQNSGTPLWSAADIGKYIAYGTYPNNWRARISNVTGGGTILTLNANHPGATITNSVQELEWGHDDSPAFAAFRTAMIGLESDIITLTCPAGRYEFVTDPNVNFSNNHFTEGLKNFTLSAYGATFSDLNAVGSHVSFGGEGMHQDNMHSTRVAATSAGDNFVTITPSSPSQPGGGALSTMAACVALFTVGQWVLLTGFDMQGSWQFPFGFPTNPFYSEYIKISAIDSNSGSPTYGKITFDRPLRYVYKTTWPHFNAGNAGEADNGGPATLYSLFPSWDCTQEYQGLTFQSPQGIPFTDAAAVTCQGRDITWRDCTWSGRTVVDSTENLNFTMINCATPHATMEADKIVENVFMTNCTGFGISLQSASIVNCTMNNVTMPVVGSTRNMTMNNCTIGNFQPGPYQYGRADSLICTNCVIPVIGIGGLFFDGPSHQGVDYGPDGITMAGGIISIPNTTGGGLFNFATSWSAPGTWITWTDGDRTSGRMFQVLDVTQDATNVYVHTSETGGFPAYDFRLSFRVHPAPIATFTNCSGTAPAGTNDGSTAYLFSQAPPGMPLYSYFKAIYDGSVASSPGYNVWGNLQSLKMNVTQPYSGAATIGAIGSYVWSTRPSQTTFPAYLFDVSQYIDLHTPGERKIIRSGGTYQVTGPFGVDTLNIPPEVPVWLGSNTNAFGYMPGGSIGSGNASITVELITDQGITSPLPPPPPTSTVPISNNLWIKLHGTGHKK